MPVSPEDSNKLKGNFKMYYVNAYFFNNVRLTSIQIIEYIIIAILLIALYHLFLKKQENIKKKSIKIIYFPLNILLGIYAW